MGKSNNVKNPIVPGMKLMKDKDGTKVDATMYKQLVGSLMYMTVTRPDMMYVVCLLSRFMSNPTELHLQAAKRVLRYLKGTVDLGVFYQRKSKEELEAYTDSDYVGDVDDKKNTSGYVFLLSKGAMSWSSKKQHVVTFSTTKAEFVAAASCSCQGVWMKRVMEKLGHSQRWNIIVFCDNSSTIKLSKNPVLHRCSKRIDVRFHFLRDLAKEGIVELKYCSKQEQIVDIMTKPLKLDSSAILAIIMFSDVDWGSDVDDRRFTFGYCILLGAHLVHWSSKRRVVSRSTTEVEYWSLDNDASKVLWVKSVLDEIGLKLLDVPRLWWDNTSTVLVVANPILHTKTEHVDLDLQFIHEKVDVGKL
ncbi:hypothetical protein GQ457_10G005790 [Hibiscus cannabinus]